ncbi:Transcription factor RF2b-like protein [Drosera capensis]
MEGDPSNPNHPPPISSSRCNNSENGSSSRHLPPSNANANANTADANAADANANIHNANNANAVSSSPSSFRGPHHRRARSDFCLRRIPYGDEEEDEDDGLFMDLSSDPSLFHHPAAIGSSTEDDDLFTTYIDVDKLAANANANADTNSNAVASASAAGSVARPHGASSIFFDHPSNNGGGGGVTGEGDKSSRPRHRHSNSVDAAPSSSGGTKGEAGNVNAMFGEMIMEAKRAMPPDMLAELWSIDPKRAKRILANRQSAARSKERKARYMLDLERKYQTLQTEATTLSAQLTLYQRDTTGLTAENAGLKLRLQAMEQQAQLRDALNEALKQEVERLRIATGAIMSPSESFNLSIHKMSPYNPRSMYSLGPAQPPLPSGQQSMQLLPFHQFEPGSLQHLDQSNSRHTSEYLQDDPFGRPQGLDISSGRSHVVKSEGPSMSASESEVLNHGFKVVQILTWDPVEDVPLITGLPCAASRSESQGEGRSDIIVGRSGGEIIKRRAIYRYLEHHNGLSVIVVHDPEIYPPNPNNDEEDLEADDSEEDLEADDSEEDLGRMTLKKTSTTTTTRSTKRTVWREPTPAETGSVPGLSLRRLLWNSSPFFTCFACEFIELLDVLENWVLQLFNDVKKGPHSVLRPENLIEEGRVSLHFFLENKGWITSISAGVGDEGINRSSIAYIFGMSIYLTDSGFQKIHEIIGYGYQYLKLWRQSPPEQWIFKELQDIGNMDFRFAEEKSQDDYAAELAVNMLLCPAEHVIYGDYAFKVWDGELFTSILSFLSPRNMRFDIVSKSFDKLEDELNEVIYRASVAKLETSLSLSSDKLELKLYGLNDKLPVLLSKVLAIVKSFLPRDDRFMIIKEEMKRSLRNANMKPMNHATYSRLRLLCKSFWDVDDKLHFLKDLSLNDLLLFIPKLLSQLYIEALCHGNLLEEEAMSLPRIFRKNLSVEPLPIVLRRQEQIFCLPFGANLVF